MLTGVKPDERGLLAQTGGDIIAAQQRASITQAAAITIIHVSYCPEP
jgi:hypothetical protein